MEFVRGLSDRLGLSLVDTAGSYAKLAASSMGTQLEGKKTREIFESVSTAASRLGLSTEESNGALLAISQMMSKGTVQAEELRGQLGERLPGAFQIAARSMGVSTAELGKMLETGQVMADEFLPKFSAELQKSFGTGKQETATFSQEWTRLKNSFENALVLLGKAGVMDALASGVRMASAAVGALSDGLEFISPQINFLFSGIQVLLESIRAGFLTLKINIEAFGVAFNTVLALVFMGLSRITTGKLSEEFRQLSLESEKTAARLRGGINKDLDGLKDAFDKASRGSIDMVVKLAGFGEEANTAGKAAKAAADKINASWQELGGSIRMASDAIDKGLKGITERLSKLKEEISANLGKLDTLFRADLAAMEGSVAASKALNAAKDANDEATHQARLHRLDEFWVTEKQRLTQSTAENLKYHKTKLAEEVAAGTSQLAAIDTLYAGQIERLKKLKQDSTKLEEEMRAKKLAVLKEMESAVRTHVDALNAELQRHRDKFVALEEEKRQLAQNTEDRLRGLQQVGMNDYEKYLDDQKQADLDMARAKEAARTGDYTAAKEWADKAAQLALQNAHEISDGEQVVITAREAAAAATQRVQAAAQLSKSAIEAEQAANLSASSRLEAERNRELAQLQQVQQAIAGIAQQSAQALELHIKAEANQVKTLMADLDKEITERERLLPIKLQLEDAEEQFRVFAEKIKAGQEVNVDTSKAKDALKALGQYAKDYPLENTLKLDNDAAMKKIADVESKVKALDRITTESQHSVQLDGPNGLTAALQKIRSLNNENTSSTHTINVVRVEQNATGGLAGAGLLASALTMPLAAFATGGPVGFADTGMPAPLHRSGTVPGVGDGDTYRADLPAGSFVIKKSATQHYGTSFLDKLSHFATGGLADRINAYGSSRPAEPELGTAPTPTSVSTPAVLSTLGQDYNPSLAAKIYQANGTDYPSVEGLRTFSPLLPVGDLFRRAIKTAIAAGQVTAADVSNVAMSRDNYRDGKHYGWIWDPKFRTTGPGNVPVFGNWVRSNDQLSLTIGRANPARGLLGDLQKKLSNPPIGWASDFMLRAAVLGSVLGKVPDSAGQLEGLVRQAMLAQDAWGSNYANAALPGSAGGPGSTLNKFASGGHARGSDTVPAMLTPGEWVVPRETVARLGVGFMHALNSMAVSQRAASVLANATAPVLHLATGGLVPGGNPTNPSGTAVAASRPVVDRVIEVRFTDGGETAVGHFSERDAAALANVFQRIKSVSGVTIKS
jgi:tape measure domain-containing protein